MSLPREDFLIARKNGIGGSDIGAIIGVSPFKSPVDVFLAKTTPNPEEEHNELFYWGHALEAPIAHRFASDHGVDVIRDVPIRHHPDHEWMIANVDGIINKSERGILEIKTVSAFGGHAWGVEGTNEVPLAYVSQCIWYMAVFDYPYAKIAALFGGNDYREFHIERDRELETILIEKGREFWFNHVLAGVPPDAHTASDAHRLFPRDTGTTMEADTELANLYWRLKSAKAQAKLSDDEVEALTTRIKLRMGDAATLTLGGEVLATWKTQTARRFDSKAFEAAHPDLCEQFRKTSESRVFRIK